MQRPFRLVRPFIFIMCTLVLIPVAPPTTAQQTTPAADLPGTWPNGATIVATGLTNPRGMTWGADGTLYVALAGSGGVTAGTVDAPPGPFHGGSTGAVARIENGCPIPIATGLPSTFGEGVGVFGVDDVAILDGQLYALDEAGTAFEGNPGTSNGIYQINADGTTPLIVDYAAWLQDNPPAVAPPEGFPNTGNPFAMIAGEDQLWVVDSVNGLIVTATPDGEVALAADLSIDHPVPTGITLTPDGGVDIGTLTAIPYPNEAAKVLHIAPDGTVTDVWTGLTAVTGVARNSDGTRYAIEMSTGNTEQAPFLTPDSGRLVRQAGPDQAEPIATGLPFPVALDIGPDGALYVALSALGTDAGEGMIVRVPINGEAVAQETFTAPSCAPIPETLTPTATPVATPES